MPRLKVEELALMSNCPDTIRVNILVFFLVLGNRIVCPTAFPESIAMSVYCICISKTRERTYL